MDKVLMSPNSSFAYSQWRVERRRMPAGLLVRLSRQSDAALTASISLNMSRVNAAYFVAGCFCCAVLNSSLPVVHECAGLSCCRILHRPNQERTDRGRFE